MGEEVVRELDEEKVKSEGRSLEVKKEKINEISKCDVKSITEEKSEEIKVEKPIVNSEESLEVKAVETNEENLSKESQKSASKMDSSCSIQ